MARTPFVTRKNPARRAYFTTLDRQQQAAFPTKALEWRDPTRELEARGWANKRWTTRAGTESGGDPFTKAGLRRLLANVLYAGKVRYKDEVHDGEQPAIIDPGVFQRVQEILRGNGRSGGAPVRNKFGALLKGLLRCTPCGCAMTPAHTTKGEKRYRYYTCTAAQKKGWGTCPSKSIPAAEIEALVVERIRCVGRDPALLQATLAQARQQDEAHTAELQAEQRGLEKDLSRWHGEVRKLSGQIRPGDDNNAIISRLADLQERIGLVEGRVKKVRDQVHEVHRRLIDEDEAGATLALFDPVWQALTPAEQVRVVHLLVERVDYDGAKGKVSIAFHAAGIRTLAEELANERKGRSA